MSNEIGNQPRYEAEVAIKFGINPLCCEKESQINSFPYSFPSFCQTTINGEGGKTELIFFLTIFRVKMWVQIFRTRLWILDK